MISDETQTNARKPVVLTNGSLFFQFQSFDIEKYKFIRVSELQNNNTKTLNGKNNLSLAGLRIDERGGIYLNPLLDTNSAYFK